MDWHKKPRPRWLECLDQKGNPSQGQGQDTGFCQPKPWLTMLPRQLTGAHLSNQGPGPFSKELLGKKTKDLGPRINNFAVA